MDQPERAPAAGLFASSPHSDSTETFADAVSASSPPGSRSSSASAATSSSFHTAPSTQADTSPRRNSSGDASNSGKGDGQQTGEDEGRRSMQRRRRGAGLASVLGSPSPPRQSRFARFVNSAAAATGLSTGAAGDDKAESLAAGGDDNGQAAVGDENSLQQPASNAETTSHDQAEPSQAVAGTPGRSWYMLVVS